MDDLPRAMWWMVPARLIGRIRPLLGRATDADRISLARFPFVVVAVVLPLAVILLALVPSVIHALSSRPLSSTEVDYFRIRVDDVYTESIVFMAGALLLGVLSPALGVLLVIAFAIFDLFAASRQSQELTPLGDSLVGRLISYWLLWLLAVEIPAFGRALATSIGPAGAARRIAAAVVAAVGTGGFAWLWTQAAAALIRPVFALSFLRTPQAGAIAPLQTGGWAIAVVGAVTAFVLVALRDPMNLLGPEEPSLASDARWQRREIAIAGHVVVSGLLTLALGGLISTPLEGLALFATFLGARPIASLIATRTPIGAVLDRMPYVLRIAAAVLVGMGLALLIVPPLLRPLGTKFLSVIVGIVVVMFVVELLTATRDRTTRGNLSPVAVGVLGAGVLLALVFLAPVVVLADNCTDLTDCYGLGAGAALAAGGTGAMLSSRKPPKPQPDKDRLKYIEKQMKKEKDNPRWPDDPKLQKTRDDYLKKQHDYWSNPQQSSDNKPTSAEAFKSSGAGTKA